MNRGANARAAYAFTAGNLVFGACNYLFQVYAAATLNRAEFGVLSAWLAQVSFIGVVAAVAQLLSLERMMSARATSLFLRGSAIVGVTVVGAELVADHEAPHVWLAAVATLGVCLFGVVAGQLQARLYLGAAALSLVGVGLFRVGYVVLACHSVTRPSAFYLSHALAGFVGVGLAGVATVRITPSAAPPRRAAGLGVRWGRPLLFAFAGIAFPQVDVLMVSFAQDEATTGRFSRVQLAARAVFFFGAGIAQMLLPYQVRRANLAEELPPFAERIERWFVPFSLLVAALTAGSAWLIVFRGIVGDERVWLFATCLSAALLVSTLALVQRLATSERYGAATSLALAVCAIAGVSALTLPTVSGYLAATIVGYAGTVTYAAFVVRRISWPREA